MTLLDIKNFVARQMGTNDGATPDAQRDGLINEAKRQFYSYIDWSFCDKTETLTITNGEVTLPSDYNTKFKPQQVYFYVGMTLKELDRVPTYKLDSYTDGVYAYDALNKKLLVKTSATSLELDYTFLPVDSALNGSDDNKVEVTSDITPINFLATGMQWLGSERAMGKDQYFTDKYNAYVKDMASADRVNRKKEHKHPLSNKNVGFNA